MAGRDIVDEAAEVTSVAFWCSCCCLRCNLDSINCRCRSSNRKRLASLWQSLLNKNEIKKKLKFFHEKEIFLTNIYFRLRDHLADDKRLVVVSIFFSHCLFVKKKLNVFFCAWCNLIKDYKIKFLESVSINIKHIEINVCK